MMSVLWCSRRANMERNLVVSMLAWGAAGDALVDVVERVGDLLRVAPANTPGAGEVARGMAARAATLARPEGLGVAAAMALPKYLAISTASVAKDSMVTR